MKIFAVLAAATFLACLCGTVRAGDAADEAKAAKLLRLMGELDSVNQEIRELESRASDLRKAWQKNRAALERDLSRVSREIAAREEVLKEINSRREEKAREIEKVEKETAAQESFCLAVAGECRGWLERMQALISSGIPWKLERRLQALEDARFFLMDEKPSPVTIVSAAERIQKQEEALGRMIESGTVRLEHGGKKVEIQAFHLGKAGVVFSDKEGSVAGFALPGMSLEKAAQAGAGDPRARGSYARALDVLFKRRAPHVAELHLPGLPKK